jgi:branched-chain amino acid transport system substrate-binding protein
MPISPARRRARTRGPAVIFTATLLGGALLMAACGGSSSGSTSSTSSAAAGGAAVLGPAKAASGTPVKLGFVSDGKTEAFDTRDETRAAQAVVAYANAHLGGLGGHPIQLITCDTNSSPTTAASCGNQLVSDKVSAVAAGSPGQTDPWVKAIIPAGIPATLNAASTQTVLAGKGAFVFGNPLATFGTPAAFARSKNLKSAAILVIDVPAASGPAKQLMPLFFGNATATANVVAIPPGTADMTPQIQAAQNKKPAMYDIIGDPTFCTSAIKAIKTLAPDATITALDRCIGTDGGASIPGGYTGVNIVAQANVDPADKEFQLYSAVIKAYGKDGLVPDSFAVSGYQGMLSLIRAVNASGTTDTSPKGITAALKSMPATPYPLGGGATFQCNGKALPGLAPNVCSNGGFLAKASSNGTLSGFSTLDTNGIYKLPAS